MDTRSLMALLDAIQGIVNPNRTKFTLGMVKRGR